MAIKTYSEVVLEDNPDIFLRLDEPSGVTAADSSGNGDDFTHSGSPTLDQAGPAGIGGKAVNYDGSDDHTTKTFGALGLSYPFTLEFWTKSPGTTGSSEFYTYWILEGGTDSGDGTHFIIRLNTDGSNNLQVSTQIRPAGASTTLAATIPNTLKGEWVHVVGVFRGTTDREIWANGVSVIENTASVSPTLATIDTLTLSAITTWTTSHVEGNAAEAAFYNHELSAERIRIHHAVGRGFIDTTRFPHVAMADGPSIYLTLGDASGNAVDSSGWKRDATAEGSPTYGESGPLSDPEGDDAVQFNGSDAAFALAGDDLGITDYPLTIEMFGKTPAAPGNNTSFARLMFGDDGTEDNFFGLDLLTDGSGNPEARGLLETGGTADHLSDAVDLNADQFYHLVWRLISATERRLYVAGSEAANDTVSRAFGSNIDDLVVGRDLAASPSFYAGTQGQILVYPRDIGAAAVTAHFDAATINFYERSMADTVSVDDIIALAFLSLITDTVDLADTMVPVWVKAMSDSVGLADSIEAVMTFVNTVQDDIDLADVATNVLKAIAVAEDVVELSEVMAARGVFIRSMSDSIAVGITINVSGTEYVGLVMNTTTLAVSTYKGWDFNSFAEIDGNYIGAGRDGVYELSGDDDDGTDIDWEIDFGFMDFDTSQGKRLPEIFYSCRNDGTIIFKVTHVNEKGDKFENWYRATRTSDALTQRRVELKKGAKSQYWRLQLLSKAGSSIDLEKIELTPLILMRRL